MKSGKDHRSPRKNLGFISSHLFVYLVGFVLVFSAGNALAVGDLTASGTVSEPVFLSTTADTVGEAVDVFDFTLIDGGVADALALDVSQVVLNTSGTGDFSKVTWRLNGPDASNVTGVYSGGGNTITFSGLSISVADSSSETYTVNAYYNDNTGVTENQTFIVSVDGDTDLTVGGSGTQMGTTTAVTNGTGSTVDVNATALSFSTQPSGSVSGSNLTTQPVVRAEDAFGNVDTDFTETVTLTEASAGTLSGGSIAAVSGVAAFTAVNYTATADQQSFTLTANDQDGVGSDLPTANANSVTSDVVATKLIFATEPAPTSVISGQATAMTTLPVVSAVNAGDVVDTGYSTDIMLAENGAGTATMTATGDTDGDGTTVSITPSSGISTFTGLNLAYTSSGSTENFTLRATSGGLTLADSTTMTALVNSPPTLTSFAAAIDSTNEDTELELTRAELDAQGDEADADGTVVAYVVQAVSAGTLKIGTNSGAATAFAVSSNDIIDATKQAYWTPASNTSGTLNAFTVKAKDNDGALSASAIQTQVTVTPIADTPSVTGASTTENTQTTTGLVINRNGVDGTEVTHFKITGITNGTLYKNDGTTAIANNAFITFAEGNAGLKFTPTLNSFANGSFNVQGATSAAGAGLSAGSALATITVSAVGDTPSVTNAGTNEDTQTTSGLVITKNANDGAEVTHYKISGISGGTLYQNNGTTVISNNAFITVAEGAAGLKFTPTANSIANGSFAVQAGTDGVGGGLSAGSATATITVTPIADTPSVTGASTSENTQTTTGLVISRNGVDGAEVTHFKITSISGGTLYKNNGTTAIANDEFITFAEGSAGLKFTPTTNSSSNGLFSVQGATSAAGAGLSAGSALATITVSAVGDTPSVTNASTNEDTQSSSGLVITRNVNDGAEVTHYKITNISGGTLYQNNGTTVISNNAFITVAEGAAGLKFTPTANSIANGSFVVQAGTDGVGGGLSAGSATATITVTPIADTPSVTGASTTEDTQTTTGLVISRNVVDGTEVTHFRITSISGGTLYKNDGTTVISNNGFITFAEGNAGLKFTPTLNSSANGSFNVQGATSVAGDGLSAGSAAATITVSALGDTPSVTNTTTDEDTQSTSGLVITKSGNDGAEITHYKISSISGGTLYQNNGTTVISNNAFITVAEGAAGLKFTPTANSIANGSFVVQAGTDGVGGGLSAGSATATITVTPIADTPSVTGASTTEDTQTTTGLVISRNVVDGTEVTHFRITSISGGTLYKNDGTTVISNNGFITFAEGNAGLKFTPTLNSSANGSFNVQGATSVAGDGLSAGSAAATITVSALGDTPSVTNTTTDEDTQSTSGLVITKSGNDGAEITHYKISSISGGTLYKNDGVTAISNNAFITTAEGAAGLKFTPTANSISNGSFDVQAGTDGVGGGLSASAATATITVTPINDAPTLGNLNGDTVSFATGGPAIVLDDGADATVADIDSSNFAGGNVTVAITVNREPAEDELLISNTGNISTSGNDVLHGATIIGTFTGGTGTDNLVINLNSQATLTRVQDLVRAIGYNNNNASTVNTTARTVQLTVSDGDGDADTSSVQSITISLKRGPIIDLDGDDSSGASNGGYNAAFTQNGPAVVVADTDTVITDDGSFKLLTITLTNRPDTTLESLSSSFGSGAQIVNTESVTIGAYNSGTGILTITIDDASTDAVTMQMLIESIHYNNSTSPPDAPDDNNRTITFKATDNDDNPGNVATTTLTIILLPDLDGDGFPDNIDPDIDGDGIDNSYEITHGLDPRDNSDAALDNDNDGLTNLQEFYNGLDPNLDDNPPVVTPPADITINATGLFTAVSLGNASATDVLDGPLTPVNNGSSHFAPGTHSVTWSATDAAGNTGTAIQIVNVVPLVEFGKNRIIAEDSIVSLIVYLNGEAVSYPVTVPYTVSGTADAGDHDLSAGTITINSGTSISTSFNVFDDGIANDTDETLIVTMGTPGNAIAGAMHEQTFTIRDGNVAPEVSLSASQGGTQLTTISKSGGSAVITATVADPNPGDSHQYDWGDSDMALIDSDMVTTTFTIDPSTLNTGAYTIRIRVTDSASVPASGSTALSLRVIESAPTLSSTDDRDGDGIDDASEGYGDDDNDGIPDYLDAINSSNILQGQEAVAVSHLIETEPGIGLTLGQIAVGSGVYQAQIDEAIIEIESGVDYSSGIYDFRITGLPMAGQSVNVVIPQASPIPADASYRKWSSFGGWSEFISNNFNRIASTAGDEGFCPPPGDVSYTEGLTEGFWCVQLTLEDGGPNDADRIANNNIDDPGGVTSGEPGSSFTGQSGGGLLGPGWLMMLLLLLIRPFGRKRRAALLALMTLLIPGISQAADWSIGLGMGRVDNSGYQSSVDSAVAASDINVAADTIKTRRNGYKLFVQYQRSKQLAWELGYLDLGDIDLDFTGTPTNRDAFISGDATLPHGSAEGIIASYAVTFPVSKLFSIYARGGAFYWDASYTLSASTDRSFDDSGLDPYYGFGFLYTFSGRYKLKLDREFFNIDNQEVHMTSLSIQYLVN